jgi:DNA-binding LytR/AlgR family response regulator
MEKTDINSEKDILILSVPQQQNKILKIKEHPGNRFIALDKILYINCKGCISIVSSVTGEEYNTSEPLKLFDFLLADYGFLRISRNTLINISHIVSCTFGKNPGVTMSNFHVLPISKRRIKYMNDRFLKYQVNHS